jgi:hypothetical protein
MTDREEIIHELHHFLPDLSKESPFRDIHLNTFLRILESHGYILIKKVNL